MNYEAFSKKVIKAVEKQVLDKRVDEDDVLGLTYKERFTVSVRPSAFFNVKYNDLLCFYDSVYIASNNSIDLKGIYDKVKTKEITVKEGIDEAIVESEKSIAELIRGGVEHFDKFNAQVKYDKEHGIKADYSDWFR